MQTRYPCSGSPGQTQKKLLSESEGLCLFRFTVTVSEAQVQVTSQQPPSIGVYLTVCPAP